MQLRQEVQQRTNACVIAAHSSGAAQKACRQLVQAWLMVQVQQPLWMDPHWAAMRACGMPHNHMPLTQLVKYYLKYYLRYYLGLLARELKTSLQLLQH